MIKLYEFLTLQETKVKPQLKAILWMCHCHPIFTRFFSGQKNFSLRGGFFFYMVFEKRIEIQLIGL